MIVMLSSGLRLKFDRIGSPLTEDLIKIQAHIIFLKLLTKNIYTNKTEIQITIIFVVNKVHSISLVKAVMFYIAFNYVQHVIEK